MKNVNKRKWLNRASSPHTGHIQYGWSIPNDRDKPYETHDFFLTISDCSRSIHLDIGCFTESDRQNSVRKLGIIASACDELIDRLNAAELDKDRRKRLSKTETKDE